MSKYNLPREDSHLDPANIPEPLDDTDEYSNCCNADPLLPTCDGMGICSHCRENATFEGEIECVS
jgi:hypothetical protein